MPTFNHSDLGERPHQSKSSRQTLADPVLGLSAPKLLPLSRLSSS